MDEVKKTIINKFVVCTKFGERFKGMFSYVSLHQLVMFIKIYIKNVEETK